MTAAAAARASTASSGDSCTATSALPCRTRCAIASGCDRPTVGANDPSVAAPAACAESA